MSNIDFTPAETTVIGVRPSSVKSALISMAIKHSVHGVRVIITNISRLEVYGVSGQFVTITFMWSLEC